MYFKAHFFCMNSAEYEKSEKHKNVLFFRDVALKNSKQEMQKYKIQSIKTQNR